MDFFFQVFHEFRIYDKYDMISFVKIYADNHH